MLNLKGECDYKTLMNTVTELAYRYKFLEFSYLTESVMGKGIPLLRFGKGDKNIYYIGAHHGAERITSALLLEFVYEFCVAALKGLKVGEIDTQYVMQTRSIFVIPQLNVDGADISANGVQKESPLYDRLLSMNGSEDFSHWQANARGVDLNHNYDAGFEEYKHIEAQRGTVNGATRFSGEYPQSEPETNALCSYMQFKMPSAVMTLHAQGREIYYTSGGECPKGAKAAAKRLAHLSGYKLSVPEGAAAYGGLTDYCIQKLGVPSFTVECGKGQNPLPSSDLFEMYAELRMAMFNFLTMF